MAAVDLIAEQLRFCESAGVEILCCPEGILGGLADYTDRPSDIALDVEEGQLQAVLAPIASKTGTTILGFTEEGDDGRLFNAAAVLHNGAILGLYRKLRPAINRSVYDPGPKTPTFKVGELSFGIVICRDSTYQEPARIMADRGTTAMLVPTNTALPPTKGGVEVVEQALQTDIARATENDLSVIRADVAGRIDGLVSYGSSRIVDHNGMVLQSGAPLEADLVVAEIETDSSSSR